MIESENFGGFEHMLHLSVCLCICACKLLRMFCIFCVTTSREVNGGKAEKFY